MTGFRRSLGGFEALVLSVAIMAPTLAMAFNVGLAVQAAGQAAPLAFLLGGLGAGLIGLCFCAFGRDIASAGSASAYVAAVFGRAPGFLAGWTLLLAYLAFLASATALTGGFLSVALEHVGLRAPGLWQGIAALGGLAVIGLGGREIRGLTLLMLAVEAIAILAILVLALVILARVPLTAAPFAPDPARGLPGLGYGMVFALLSLAGFEGAATVAEETRDPHRAIPRAILGSLAVATLLYVLVSYAQVLGYRGDGLGEGLGDGMAALAGDAAPLDRLAARHLGPGYAVFLDVAAGVSSLACALGTASAAARILYALGRSGLGRALAVIDPAHGAPRRALRTVGAANLAGLALFGPFVTPRAYSEGFATIATLALILVYAAVALAQVRAAGAGGRRLMRAVGGLGALAMVWPFLNSLVPLPPWPGPLWPLAVLAWTALGFALLRARPGLAAVGAP